MTSTLAALGPGATYDPAGRLLFSTHELAYIYAAHRATFTRSRQRVRRLRASHVPGYSWHVSVVPEAPAATERELLTERRPCRVGLVGEEACS